MHTPAVCLPRIAPQDPADITYASVFDAQCGQRRLGWRLEAVVLKSLHSTLVSTSVFYEGDCLNSGQAGRQQSVDDVDQALLARTKPPLDSYVVFDCCSRVFCTRCLVARESHSCQVLCVLPQCVDMVEGVLGADLVGFHTYNYLCLGSGSVRISAPGWLAFLQGCPGGGTLA